MSVWTTLILVVQILSALAMIGLVLLQHGKGIQCQLDLCHPDSWQALERLLSDYRPGQTPVLLQLKTASSEGRLRVPEHHAVRCETGLISKLRQMQGIKGSAQAGGCLWIID